MTILPSQYMQVLVTAQERLMLISSWERTRKYCATTLMCKMRKYQFVRDKRLGLYYLKVCLKWMGRVGSEWEGREQIFKISIELLECSRVYSIKYICLIYYA